MFEHLNSVFQLMGRGLANQDFGEMTPTAEKIAQIEKWSHHYRLSGGQGRIVLIASTDPMGPAFDFVVELAKKTRSLIEILYLKPEAEVKTPLAALLSQLGDLPHDFQITFVAGNLLKTISDYSKQRQDIVAVVSSASEEFTEELRSAPQTLDPVKSVDFPDILLIGNSILA